MRPAGQQFGGALAHTLRAFAPQEPTVVQEELQQLQVGPCDVPSQEEVVPQTAVEVLDERTRPRRFGQDVPDGLFDAMEPAAQEAAQPAMLLLSAAA